MIMIMIKDTAWLGLNQLCQHNNYFEHNRMAKALSIMAA